MPKVQRFYVTVAGGFKVASVTNKVALAEAIWIALGSRGSAWCCVKEKDLTGRMRSVEVQRSGEDITLTPADRRDAGWAEEIEAMLSLVRDDYQGPGTRR